jgi:hypothetical protein
LGEQSAKIGDDKRVPAPIAVGKRFGRAQTPDRSDLRALRQKDLFAD